MIEEIEPHPDLIEYFNITHNFKSDLTVDIFTNAGETRTRPPNPPVTPRNTSGGMSLLNSKENRKIDLVKVSKPE